MRLPLAFAIALLSAGPTMAADATPAVDLVAAFVLGARDSAVLSLGKVPATVIKAGPGEYEATPSGGGSFAFKVTEKPDCVFDVGFNQGGVMRGGIEVDAKKLVRVTYEKREEHETWTYYWLTLVGADGIVQDLGPAGELRPTSNSASVSTDMTEAEMLAAVAEFQQSYCPAAAG